MKNRTFTLILLLAALLVGATVVCQGQVRVDLRTQSRNVDFGQAASTRPFQTGAILPVTCQQGEVYYLTTATAGQNVHLCQASGSWVKVAAEESAGNPNYTQSFSGATLVTLTHNSGTVSVVASCFDASGGAIEWNSFRIVDVNTAEVTFSTAQSGRCVVNRTGGGDTGTGVPAQAGENGKVLATNGSNPFWSAVSQLQGRPVAVSQPLDGQALVWSEANGRWEPGAVVGGGGGASLTPGTGIVISGGSTQTVGLDTALVPTYLTAAMSLTFTSISNATCKTASMTVPGALNGDSVAAGWPNTLETGLMGMMLVTTPDTVTVRICNLSGATVTPANQTYRATIVRTF